MKKVLLLLLVPILLAGCMGIPPKPTNTMSSFELHREYDALNKKLYKDGALQSVFGWNKLMKRHTDLGMELSSRGYWDGL